MGVAKWRKFSQEEIETVVKSSRSVNEVAQRLGYASNSGGVATTIKSMFKELDIDISHFTGQNWNSGNYDYGLYIKNGPKRTGQDLSAPIIALRGHKCEDCGMIEWKNQPIKLEVHHIDGDSSNNELGNLLLLCPNCHSCTETFKKNHKRAETIPEETFVSILSSSKSVRQALLRLGLRASGDNYSRSRELIHKYKIEHLY